MLLAIDVGNTNTVIGIARDGTGWDHVWRLSTIRTPFGVDWMPTLRAFAERDKVDLGRVSRVAIGSVVPVVTNALTDLAGSWLRTEPLIISARLQLPIRLGQDAPEQVGVDRIANMVAARAITTDPVIVVDLGTATKVEALDGSGTFRGGAIAPGFEVMTEALTSRAARLFLIHLELPDQAIGRNTEEAMQSGIVLGHFLMIEGLIHHIAVELETASPVVIVTGGHAEDPVSPFRRFGHHNPTLTLDGIRLIADLNNT